MKVLLKKNKLLDDIEKIDEEPDPINIKKEFKRNYERMISEFRSHSPDRTCRNHLKVNPTDDKKQMSSLI